MKIAKVLIIAILLSFCMIWLDSVFRINMSNEIFEYGFNSPMGFIKLYLLLFGIIMFVFVIFIDKIASMKNLLFILLLIDVCIMLFCIFIFLPMAIANPINNNLVNRLFAIIVFYSITKYIIFLIFFIMIKYKKQIEKDLNIKYTIIKKIDVVFNILFLVAIFMIFYGFSGIG